MIINLTPHKIVVVGEDGTVLAEIAPSGSVARVATSRTEIGSIDGGDGVTIPIYSTAFGAVEGLPAPEAGTIFVVSALVAGAAKGREDVVSPGELVRGADGQPIGCRGFSRLA